MTLFRQITYFHTYNEFDGVRSFDSSDPVPMERFRGNGQFMYELVGDCYSMKKTIQYEGESS